MSCTSSILLATLNQGWCKVKGENEWNAQRRINILEANLWSRVQSVNLWSNLKSESYLLQGRARMKWKNQKGRQFLHRPKGRQFLHRPRGQQFLHRPRRDNSFYTVPTFWERSNSFRTAPRYRMKNFEMHKCRPSVGATFEEGGEGAGERPGKEWQRIQRPPF